MFVISVEEKKATGSRRWCRDHQYLAESQVIAALG